MVTSEQLINAIITMQSNTSDTHPIYLMQGILFLRQQAFL